MGAQNLTRVVKSWGNLIKSGCDDDDKTVLFGNMCSLRKN